MSYLQCHTCNCNIDDGNHICEIDKIDDIIEDDNSTEELHENSSTEYKDTDLTERLISEVFMREPLWNSKLPYKHRGPANIKLLWNEVDTCLGKVHVIILSLFYYKKIYNLKMLYFQDINL